MESLRAGRSSTREYQVYVFYYACGCGVRRFRLVHWLHTLDACAFGVVLHGCKPWFSDCAQRRLTHSRTKPSLYTYTRRPRFRLIEWHIINECRKLCADKWLLGRRFGARLCVQGLLGFLRICAALRYTRVLNGFKWIRYFFLIVPSAKTDNMCLEYRIEHIYHFN